MAAERCCSVREGENKQVRDCSLRLILLSLFILCVLITIFALLSQDVKADTYVAGHITQDTTWNVSGSPYIVYQDVYVDKDVTLTIEPDVEVKFNFTDLTVYGHLLAIGNESHPIIFSSNNNFEWGGIKIEDSGDAVFNWCNIYKGEYGFDLIGPQACSIQNTTISESTYAIYFRLCSNLTLSQINISDSYYSVFLVESVGIKFSAVHFWNTTYTEPVISAPYSAKMYYNHTFINCSSNGRPFYYFFDLIDTQFSGLEASHITVLFCDNVIIDRCNVTGDRGIKLLHTVNSDIINCIITGGDMGIELLFSGEGDYDFSHGNLISNNTIMSNTKGIRLGYSDYNIITDNQILSNTHGIYLYYSSSNMIFHNNFINNDEHAYQSSHWQYSNSYDNGEEGNYWDDYEGEDIGGDGIGDEYQFIWYSAQDYHPLMAPWTGSLPPDTTPAFFLENPQISEENLIIPRDFVLISFEVSERGYYEIVIDTDGNAGFDNSTDTVLFGNLTQGGNDRLWNGFTNQAEFVEDGDYELQIMIWDRAGNPADDPFNLGNVTIHRDMDGDGHFDADDAFPDDPHEWTDMDGDGIGDNSDPDLDGDGVENGSDAFPADPDEWSDMDNDDIGDNADPDDNDNDIPDIAEIPLVLFILVIPLLVFYYTNKHVKGKKEGVNQEEGEKKEEKQ